MNYGAGGVRRGSRQQLITYQPVVELSSVLTAAGMHTRMFLWVESVFMFQLTSALCHVYVPEVLTACALATSCYLSRIGLSMGEGEFQPYSSEIS